MLVYYFDDALSSGAGGAGRIPAHFFEKYCFAKQFRGKYTCPKNLTDIWLSYLASLEPSYTEIE